MQTTYSKKIADCSFDDQKMILSIKVSWTAIQGDIEVSYDDLMGLQPPPENPIPYEEITEEIMISWYEQSILGYYDVYKPDGKVEKDTETIEFRIKKSLDDKIEDILYQRSIETTQAPAGGTGLPFTINN
jgi:hypothetical protein